MQTVLAVMQRDTRAATDSHLRFDNVNAATLEAIMMHRNSAPGDVSTGGVGGVGGLSHASLSSLPCSSTGGGGGSAAGELNLRGDGAFAQGGAVRGHGEGGGGGGGNIAASLDSAAAHGLLTSQLVSLQAQRGDATPPTHPQGAAPSPRLDIAQLLASNAPSSLLSSLQQEQSQAAQLPFNCHAPIGRHMQQQQGQQQSAYDGSPARLSPQQPTLSQARSADESASAAYASKLSDLQSSLLLQLSGVRSEHSAPQPQGMSANAVFDELQRHLQGASAAAAAHGGAGIACGSGVNTWDGGGQSQATHALPDPSEELARLTRMYYSGSNAPLPDAPLRSAGGDASAAAGGGSSSGLSAHMTAELTPTRQ